MTQSICQRTKIIKKGSFIPEKKHIMKKYILLTFFLASVLQLSAQQEPQFTQFMFNKLVYNPGYAGSDGGPCVAAIYRGQWIGVEGAPQTQALSFHMPISKNRVGLGLSVLHDNIGPSDSWTASMAYSYRILTERGAFGIGLQGSVFSYSVDFTNESAVHSGDVLIQGAENSKIIPNVGGGLYYQDDKFYIGVSVPNIIRSDISLLTTPTSDLRARKETHVYAMVGAMLNLSKKVQLKPALLFKYANNAPFDMDINLSTVFLDRFLVGLTYRLGGSTVKGGGESIDIVAQFMASQSISIGVAFDFSLSEFSQYSPGSFEVMVQYCLGKKEGPVANSRFF